ncbi:MAG: hypothetical protein KDJ99_21420, partial [Candidatus Competibacteraceae bacterium]|nr:hypothetical protein [Candidatus Competibacteraceae bacterium]
PAFSRDLSAVLSFGSADFSGVSSRGGNISTSELCACFKLERLFFLHTFPAGDSGGFNNYGYAQQA